MEEETKEEPLNLTDEQITELGAMVGVKEGQRYCNMANVYTHFVYLLSILLGRPTESQTMNFDCFKRIFAELPQSSYKRLRQVLTGIADMEKKTKTAQEHMRDCNTKMNRAEEALGKVRSVARREKRISTLFLNILVEERGYSEEPLNEEY